MKRFALWLLLGLVAVLGFGRLCLSWLLSSTRYVVSLCAVGVAGYALVMLGALWLR